MKKEDSAAELCTRSPVPTAALRLKYRSSQRKADRSIVGIAIRNIDDTSLIWTSVVPLSFPRNLLFLFGSYCTHNPQWVRMKFEEVVLKRRMFRNFHAKPVPRDVIDCILAFAQHAPSAGFSQGWAYVVVTAPEMRKKVGDVQGENDYYANRRFHKFVSEAPVLIVACVSERLYHDRYREPDKIREDGTEIEWPVPFWYFDIGCACMLIFLAAVNEGLAAAFTGVFQTDRMRGLLGIPEHFHPVGVISIGYPSKDVRSPSLRRGRKSFQDIVHHERW